MSQELLDFFDIQCSPYLYFPNIFIFLPLTVSHRLLHSYLSQPAASLPNLALPHLPRRGEVKVEIASTCLPASRLC